MLLYDVDKYMRKYVLILKSSDKDIARRSWGYMLSVWHMLIRYRLAGMCPSTPLRLPPSPAPQ